ncbi:serine-rich adhesin for platelets-like [Mercenaria mercenaria]|uniref:serine-rich adhesin for platelets-like n=1 Tax=Mercenaria mercenaria TaxID=6596 RepID=UPI00234F30E0|nr:serine-rich adhesin for platelets-like [Mercenaria mercenaria]XP_053397977.1 serine-rich adhesin for platelets-like [Mercenaria mercenaria]
MGDNSNFLSIDEQAISNRSIDLEEATDNLQRLQKHIFHPKSSTDFPKSSTDSTKSTDCTRPTNYQTYSTTYTKSSSDYQNSITGSKSSTSYPTDCLDSSTSNFSSSAGTCKFCTDNSRLKVGMDSGRNITLPSGKGIFFDRQPSVNDEDLFGDGQRKQGENQAHPNLGNLTKECIEENTDQLDAVDTNKVNKFNFDNKKIEEKDADGIPNFGMLGLSSSSGSDSPTNSPKSFKHMEVQNKQDIEEERHLEFSDGQDSDFKMRYLDGRSISADDRRKKFRNSSGGGEVFDHEIESVEEEYCIGKHVRKSNSLPDLVVSSNQSPFSPPRYHSNPSPKPGVAENLEKQYETKKILEGSSSMPTTKGRHKIKRTVSIKEEPEYIPTDYNDKSGNERSPKTQSAETEQRRRSSGYVTGSSEAGSQDKSEMGTSRQTSQLSQSSSGVWTSQESEMVENAETAEEAKYRALVNISQSKDMQPTETHFLSTHSSGSTEKHSVSPVSFASGGNESNSTESSVNTILDAGTHEAIRMKISNSPNGMETQLQGETTVNTGSSSGELPNLSIMCTSSGPGSSSGTFARLRSKDESIEKNGARSKVPPASELKPPDSFEPQSHGNLPNFSTLQDSFSLNKSSLQKVHEEDDKNHRAVKNKYCEGEDGSFGAGSVWPSSISPSSRGSSSSNPSPPESVKRWEEMMMRLGLDTLSPSFLDKILQDIRGPDSLSPHSNLDKEKIEGSGSQNFKDVTLDDLERASRCNFTACSDTCCLKMREVLRVLTLDIPDLDPSYKLVKSYYGSLTQHCENGCEETKCSVVFCSEFLDWEIDQSEDPVKHFVREFQKYCRNPTMKLFLQTSNKFHKLQSYIPPKMEVKEFETHTPMFPLGKFTAAHVCMDNMLQKLVVLKMYPLMECDQQLSLYTRLKDLNHPNIVTQLWMLAYEEKIQVCSLFAQGGSLEEYLSHVGKLPWPRVVLYMKQILSAVTHLNSLGVVYLNWNSGNMLYPDDRRHTIQVGNFSLSCPVNCHCDIGTVKDCLPYNICPPELLQWNYKADFRSDIWGAGCLFYEMVAGTPFLHELRHEDRETVHKQIRDGSLPDISSWSKEKRNILYFCWQEKMEDRGSLESVLRYIQSLRVR